MIPRGIYITLALSALLAADASPQGLAIDHKQVGCIIVGKYPKMNACFTPASSLARGRVYFRPEGATSWYYVEMKSDQPCSTGVLPKPGKKLVGKKIEYYVEGQDKTFNAARTAEYDPVVVRSAQECKKQVPVAPFLNNASVAVFPSLPAGFAAGGIGTGAVLGIVGAGAAAAGTAAVVASNNNETTTTTIAIGGNTTTTVTTNTTSTTTTTSTTLKTNHAPFAVLTTKPDPPEGLRPLTVTFDLCKSTDPDGDPLQFFFNFGDGSKTSGSCIESHTYSATVRAAGTPRAQDISYPFEASVVDPGGLSATRTRTVVAKLPTPPPPPACTPATPTITLLSPMTDTSYCINIPFSANATNAFKVQFFVDDESFGCGYTPTQVAMTEVSGSGPNYAAKINMTGVPGSCFRARARAFNCGGATADEPNPPDFIFVNFSCSPPSLRSIAAGDMAAWSSDLTLEGGRLQVIVNGGDITFPSRGRAYGMMPLARGENRVEATLVEGGGKPGLWRFDFMGSQGVAPGSIRVIAGEVSSLSSTSVTFRLQGTPGERIAFTFRRR